MKIDKSWYTKLPHIPDRPAAGGIVARQTENQILIALIQDEDYPMDYALPKGGIEEGETIDEAARREIKEETGFERLENLGFLGMNERLNFNKKTWSIAHYFLFATDEIEPAPTDQTHNYIVHWFSIDKLPQMFWPDQKELIVHNRKKIKSLLHTYGRKD